MPLTNPQPGFDPASFSVVGWGVMRRIIHPATPWIQWLRILGFVLLLGHASAAAPVILNEFLASNSRSIEDEDGDRPDWIELFNPGTTSVNLLG